MIVPVGGVGGGIVRYFFEITNGTTCFKDDQGQRCRSRIAAGVQAAHIAAELAAEGGGYTGFVVRLLDARGSELARVPVGPPPARRSAARRAA